MRTRLSADLVGGLASARLNLVRVLTGLVSFGVASVFVEWAGV